MNTTTLIAAVWVTLLTLCNFCYLEAKPVVVESLKEDVETRGMVFDPTADTDFQVKVGDITYFTRSYLEILNDKPEFKHTKSVNGKEKRAAVRDRRLLWPRGVIPYVFSTYYSESQTRTVSKAMAHWEENTCIRFVKRTTERDYLYIYPGPGCSSYVGQTQYEQRVSIGPSCFAFHTALHELGHAIGFYHEQSRPDRDDHVEILDNNIVKGAASQFDRLSEAEVNSMGVGYDYNSIMHYDRNLYAKDYRLNTIVALDPTIPVGGNRVLSPLDILQTNMLYGCSNSTKEHPPRTTISPTELVTEKPIPMPKFSCGRIFDGELSGCISSPGYDRSNYNNNQDCEWNIRVPTGYQLQLKVHLSMDYSSGCTKDYVEVHERFDRSGYRLGRWCYHDYRLTTYTLNNIATVRFHTDQTNVRQEAKGFELCFKAVDINECEWNYCSHNCTNLPRSYECSCPKGFYLAADGKQCFDTNECALNKGGCDHRCVNRGGSFRCECDEGYSLLSDRKTCSNLETQDPCISANCQHDCVVNSDYTARCMCPKGEVISSDGKTCMDDDECSRQNGGCQSICTNSQGSFECSCTLGYTLASDLLSCEDVNECATNNGGCVHVCENTIGSFQCSCNEEFVLLPDGFSCAMSSSGPVISEDLSGEIHTPNWPDTYPTNVDLEWIVRCPKPDQTIKFSWQSQFSIGGRQSQGCPKDWVTVRAGETEDGTLYGPYCERTIPEDLEIISSNAVVLFHSGYKHHKTRLGFELFYSCIDPPTTSSPTTPPTTGSPTTPPTTGSPTTTPTTGSPTTPPTTGSPTTPPTTGSPTTPPTTGSPTTPPTTGSPTTPPTTGSPTTPPTTGSPTTPPTTGSPTTPPTTGSPTTPPTTGSPTTPPTTGSPTTPPTTGSPTTPPTTGSPTTPPTTGSPTTPPTTGSPTTPPTTGSPTTPPTTGSPTTPPTTGSPTTPPTTGSPTTPPTTGSPTTPPTTDSPTTPPTTGSPTTPPTTGSPTTPPTTGSPTTPPTTGSPTTPPTTGSPTTPPTTGSPTTPPTTGSPTIPSTTGSPTTPPTTGSPTTPPTTGSPTTPPTTGSPTTPPTTSSPTTRPTTPPTTSPTNSSNMVSPPVVNISVVTLEDHLRLSTESDVCVFKTPLTTADERFTCNVFLRPGTKFGMRRLPQRSSISTGSSKCLYRIIGFRGRSYRLRILAANLPSHSLKIYKGFGTNDLFDSVRGCINSEYTTKVIHNQFITVVFETSNKASTAGHFVAIVEEV